MAEIASDEAAESERGVHAATCSGELVLKLAVSV